MGLLRSEGDYVISSYLILLLYNCKKKDDLRKALWILFEYGYDMYHLKDFNKSWEMICKSARVAPKYEMMDGVKKIHESVVDLIAESLYENPEHISVIKALRDMNYENDSADEVKEQFKEHKQDYPIRDDDKR